MKELLQRRILFVGGKGGVGKTTTAASLAMTAAEAGKKCLVVSTDPAHSLSDIFETKIGDKATNLKPNLSGLEIDPNREADRYIATVKSNMRDLVHPEMFSVVERQMNLARQAPGSLEAALLERMTNLVTETKAQYDILIFDTAPTGHTMQLLSLPEAMAAWTDGMLKRHKKSRHLGKLLDTLGGSRKGRQPLTPLRTKTLSRTNVTPKSKRFSPLDATNTSTLVSSWWTATRRHSYWS